MTEERVSRRTLLGTTLGASLAVPVASLGGPARAAAAQEPRTWSVHESIRPVLTPVADMAAAPSDEQHVSIAPNVPPPIARSDQRTWDVHLESIEGICPLDPPHNINTEMWGYRVAGQDDVLCGSPGPVLRGRVGDFVTISLTCLASNMNPHNIDFHSITGQGGGAAALTVNPGETKSVYIRLLYPGAFMYHCAYGDVPSHIAHGMYGMFIVDSEEPLPAVDHEWSISQSEWYVGVPGPTEEGVAPFDREALTNENPRYVTFNGRTDALVGDRALTMNTGERGRIYFVNQGLNLISSFHPIGSHWDLVYPEAATHPSNRAIRGSQSTLVVAGGGTVTEIDALVPSTIILVDHALVRAFYKGAIGQIVIAGDPDPEIFGVPEGQTEAVEVATPVAEIDVEIHIPEGAYLPENADHGYDPPLAEFPVGTTVRWTNNDTVAHTVTSGFSNGMAGTPDGYFDSGFVEPGGTFVFTFTEAIVHPYYCVPHPWMRGTIVVTA